MKVSMILEKNRAPSENVFRKGLVMKQTELIARELGGFETTYHHEAHARHLVCLGPG